MNARSGASREPMVKRLFLTHTSSPCGCVLSHSESSRSKPWYRKPWSEVMIMLFTLPPASFLTTSVSSRNAVSHESNTSSSVLSESPCASMTLWYTYSTLHDLYSAFTSMDFIFSSSPAWIALPPTSPSIASRFSVPVALRPSTSTP